MQVSGPDGTLHDFPDDATNDEILNFFNKPASGAPPVAPVGGSPPDASAPTAPVDQPSFISRMLSGWAQQPRILSNALTGGLSDVVSGAVRSALPGGGTMGENIRSQQAMTEAGKAQIGPIPSAALETAGTIMGPGKLSIASKAPGLLSRVAGSAAENAALSGFEAGLQGQDVKGATVSGAIGGAVAPVAGKVLGALGNKLPESLGGAIVPDVPTGASLRAGRAIKPTDTYRRADLLDQLDTMRYNAANTGTTLPTQAKSFISKDIGTGLSKADEAGMTPAEQKILSKVGTTTPVSSYMMQHPKVALGVLGPVSELPALVMGLHGNPGGAVAAGLLGGAADIGAFQGANYLANRGARSSMDEVSRAIGGVPSQPGSMQQAMASPEWRKALQALMFSGTLGQ